MESSEKDQLEGMKVLSRPYQVPLPEPAEKPDLLVILCGNSNTMGHHQGSALYMDAVDDNSLDLILYYLRTLRSLRAQEILKVT